MRITMSPQDYATAFHLLSSTSKHHLQIAGVIEERVLPHLPAQPSLLDVGAGPGKIAEVLAPHLGAVTLVEPNREQLAGFSLGEATIFPGTFEDFSPPGQYDIVLCSHMLYHVPQAQWGAFVDRLLSLVRPGGYCVIVLGADRGQNYEMHRDFTGSVIDSSRLLLLLEERQIPFEVAATRNSYTAQHLDDMVTLCRFFVLEDCFTPDQLAALTDEEAGALEAKIRGHAEGLRIEDGTYRLEQDDDVILVRKQAPG